VNAVCNLTGRVWVAVPSLRSRCSVSVSEKFPASTYPISDCGVGRCGPPGTV